MNGEIMCRGSYALGTACGRCRRCEEELQRMKAAMQSKPSGAQPDSKLYIIVRNNSEAQDCIVRVYRDLQRAKDAMELLEKQKADGVYSLVAVIPADEESA